MATTMRSLIASDSDPEGRNQTFQLVGGRVRDFDPTPTLTAPDLHACHECALHRLLERRQLYRAPARRRGPRASLLDALLRRPHGPGVGEDLVPQLQLFRAVRQGKQRARVAHREPAGAQIFLDRDRKSTRLNSSHGYISYAVFCLKKK